MLIARTLSLICIILIYSSTFAYQQTEELDSVSRKLLSIKEDTSKVNYLNDVSKTYWRIDNNLALKYAKQALKLGAIAGFKRGECRALNYVGIAYTNIGDYLQAENYLQQAYDLAIDLEDEDNQLKILNSQGIVQRKKGNYPQAIDYMLKSLRLIEKTGDDKTIGIVNMNIGNVYFNLKEFDSAKAYYQRAIPLYEKLNFSRGLEFIYNNLGDVYGELQDFDPAIDYFLKSLDYKLKSNNLSGIAITYTNIGELYYEKDSLEIAHEYLKKSLDYFNKAGIKTEIANAYYGLGRINLRKGKNQESLIDFKEAYNTAKKFNLKHVVKNSSQLMSIAYENMGRKDLAFRYFKEYVYLKDSLVGEANFREVTRLKHRFEVEKNEQEIQLLEVRNLRAQAEIEKKDARQLAIISIVILLLILIGYVFISQRQKNKLKQNLLAAEISDLRTKLTNLVGPENLKRNDLNDKLVNPLSEREFEIYKLAITQKSNRDIADELSITISTVKFHLNNVYTKLGVNNRKEALAFAVKST